MTNNTLRKEIVAIARRFNSTGLSFGRSGNVSARTTRGFLITATGITYADMKTSDIVEMDHTGRTLVGMRKPSSEWHMHSAIYKKRRDVNAVVHVHSPYATGVACTRKPVPAFHYMVTVLGGASIPCAQYASFGTIKLARNAVTALGNLHACLLANHGQIAVAEDLATAFRYAGEVETLARMYCISLMAGGPVLLDDAEMQVNIEKFKTYGKQC